MSNYVQQQFIGEPLVRETSLRLAVQPIDAFTDRRPLGHPHVTIEETDVAPVANLSGYFLFLESEPNQTLPDNEVTVRVTSGSLYRPASEQVDLSTLPQSNPVLAVRLTPSTAYPFPAGETLVRGQLVDAHTDPIAGARIDVRNAGLPTQTTANGEFVTFFANLTADDVEEVESEDWTHKVVIDDEDPVFEIRFDDREESVSVTVPEGKLTKVRLVARADEITIDKIQYK